MVLLDDVSWLCEEVVVGLPLRCALEVGGAWLELEVACPEFG